MADADTRAEVERLRALRRAEIAQRLASVAVEACEALERIVREPRHPHHMLAVRTAIAAHQMASRLGAIEHELAALRAARQSAPVPVRSSKGRTAGELHAALEQRRLDALEAQLAEPSIVEPDLMVAVENYLQAVARQNGGGAP